MNNVPWWIYDVIVAVTGLGLTALGVFDHDNQELILAGVALISGSLAHTYGVARPPAQIRAARQDP